MTGTVATDAPTAEQPVKDAERAKAPEQAKTVPIAVWTVATIGVLVEIAHALFGFGGSGLDRFFNDWLYNGLILLAAALCFAKVLWTVDDRPAYAFFGIGLLAFSAGDIYFSLALADQATPPVPSAADIGYLLFYPASYIGLVLLIRARVHQFQTSVWLDGLVGALALGAFVSAVAFGPVIERIGGSAGEMTVNIAYPICDILLLGIVIGVFAITGWRPGKRWLMLGAGLAMFAIADTTYLYQSAGGSYSDGGLINTLWPAATLAIAASAWMQQSSARIRLDGWRMQAMPFAFAAMAVWVLVWDNVREINSVAMTLTTGALIAVIIRLGLTFTENFSLAEGKEQALSQALTDPLTGLSNRRELMADLDVQMRYPRENPRMLAIFDLDGFKRYNDTYGHPAGDTLLARLGGNLNAAVNPKGKAYRIGGDEFCVICSIEDGPEITKAASHALSEMGGGFDITSSFGTTEIPREASTTAEALRLADQRMYAQKAMLPDSAGQQTRDLLLRVLEQREPELHQHIRDVTDLAVMLGRRLDLDEQELHEVARAAELHDIGKVAVPDAILDKPGPLDPDEWAFMRRHTIIGEQILSVVQDLAPVARLVRSSHERWDGKGYPDGLQGEEIPLGARIVAVCDAFNAMTSDRPYQAALTTREALDEIRYCAGTQFDPIVAARFCREIEESRSLPPSGPTPRLMRDGAGSVTRRKPHSAAHDRFSDPAVRRAGGF